jgi:hypothetical protein
MSKNLGKNLQHQCLNINPWPCLCMETITVDKQPNSNHSLVYVTSSGKEKSTKFSDIKYQCWKNYSHETLKTELKKIFIFHLKCVKRFCTTNLQQTWPINWKDKGSFDIIYHVIYNCARLGTLFLDLTLTFHIVCFFLNKFLINYFMIISSFLVVQILLHSTCFFSNSV